MPPKNASKGQKTPTSMDNKSTSYEDSDFTIITPRYVSLSIKLQGEKSDPGEWNFLAFYNGQVILEGKWQDGLILETESLSLNLQDPYYQALVADKPIIFIVRTVGGKGTKDPDPLLNMDNQAGGTVDLFPLLLGEEQVFVKVPLVLITTGENTGCSVQVRAHAGGISEIPKVPLLMTMISAHCMPFAKDGTVYLSAIGLNGIFEPMAVNFGMSVSSFTANKVVWAAVSNGGQAANSTLNVPNEDQFISEDLIPQETADCRSFYWNAMKRVLVDPVHLRERLSSPFLIEVAGVPRTGKIDIRGRFMGFIDAGVLLEPGQFGVTIATKLLFYNEMELPENVGALLELPPSSAKVSARDTDIITDEFGHNAYVVLRFDLTEPLIPKAKMASLFETLGFLPPEGPAVPVNELDVEPPAEDGTVDVRRIRKEGGALAVHRELSGLACKGAIPMNQGIKRTAANRLLMRVRSMLKQFSPGFCPYIDWQDLVTAQHAASRRAVTASFAPQPPPLRLPTRAAAARCRIAGDNRIAKKHVINSLKVAPNHPRSLLSKALRCLEERHETEARSFILEALNVQTRNKYLLWIFGAQEYDKGDEAIISAAAAFRVAVKGDYSDGTSNAIGFAALHGLYHYKKNPYAAFVAAKKMRKSYELPREWNKFIERWVDISGEEEIFWIPTVVNSQNPMLIAAAFFLCLRCYKFSERLLTCFERGCGTHGSRLGLKTKIGPDIYYLRAASWLLRRQLDSAMEIIDSGIKRFGPSAIISQIRTVSLMCAHGWDGKCETAFRESERAGAEPCPALLLTAALGGLKTNPEVSLQRAARAHKIAPGGHSALVIGMAYARLDEEGLAERWAAAAVKAEPLLADGWAFLALLAMYERDLDKARTMLRTAKQVGPISMDIEVQLNKMMKFVKLDALPDTMVKNLCLCDYY